MDKKISIIIPVYNAEDYIADCLDSCIKHINNLKKYLYQCSVLCKKWNLSSKDFDKKKNFAKYLIIKNNYYLIVRIFLKKLWGNVK